MDALYHTPSHTRPNTQRDSIRGWRNAAAFNTQQLKDRYGRISGSYVSAMAHTMAGAFKFIGRNPCWHGVAGRVPMRVWLESVASVPACAKTKHNRVQRLLEDGFVVYGREGNQQVVDIPNFAADFVTADHLLDEVRRKDRQKKAAKREATRKPLHYDPNTMHTTVPSEPVQRVSPPNLNTIQPEPQTQSQQPAPKPQAATKPPVVVEAVGPTAANRVGKVGALAIQSFLGMIPQSAKDALASSVVVVDAPGAALPPKPNPQVTVSVPLVSKPRVRTVTPDYDGEPACAGQVADLNSAYGLRLDARVVAAKGIGWNSLFNACESSTVTRLRGCRVSPEAVVMHNAMQRKRGLWGHVSYS